MSFAKGGGFNEVNKLAFIAGSVTVETTATLLVANSVNLEGRQRIEVYNMSDRDVWLGPSDVDITDKGIPLAPGQTKTYYFGENVSLYGIVKNGTAKVVVHEVA